MAELELDELYQETVDEVESFTGRTFDNVPELVQREGRGNTVFHPVRWEIQYGSGIQRGSDPESVLYHELAHGVQASEQGVKGLRAIPAGFITDYRHGSLHAKLLDREGFAEWVAEKHSSGNRPRNGIHHLGYMFYHAYEEQHGEEATLEMALDEYLSGEEMLETVKQSDRYGWARDGFEAFLDRGTLSVMTDYYGDL